MNQFNDQLPVGLLAQLVRALQASLIFFRLSFRNCISCVNKCEDLLYIYFFIPQFKYTSFIYSYFQREVSCIDLDLGTLKIMSFI